jgi:hypothetical protein
VELPVGALLQLAWGGVTGGVGLGEEEPEPQERWKIEHRTMQAQQK